MKVLDAPWLIRGWGRWGQQTWKLKYPSTTFCSKGFAKPGTQNSHYTDPVKNQDKLDQQCKDKAEEAPPLQH